MEFRRFFKVKYSERGKEIAMQARKIQAAVFDVDGTLLDSMPLWDTVGSDYLRSKGITPKPDMEERVRTMSMMQIAAYCQQEYGMKESVQQIIDEINGMVIQKYREEVLPKPGVLELLQKLHKMGIRLAVATASDRCLIEPALIRNGLLPYFDVFLTCTEAGAGKDSPKIFQLACEKLRTQPETTVIFEDSLYAMRTAKKAGFPVAAVFDESARRETTEIQHLADWYANSPADWLASDFPWEFLNKI